MNPNIEALRAELKARFESTSQLLDQIETALYAPLAPTTAAPDGPAKRPAPDAPKPRGARSKPSRHVLALNDTEQRLREVIATLAEPFATRAVFAALEKRDAAFARKTADSGTLGYTMKKLRAAGQLIGDGTGKGMTYTRSKKFAAEPQLSEKEAAYRKLRAEIPTPPTDS